MDFIKIAREVLELEAGELLRCAEKLGSEIEDAVNLSHIIELPRSGLWYISMTAVDENALESELSGIQQITI